jgi:anti-anti-sigma regulatory factor
VILSSVDEEVREVRLAMVGTLDHAAACALVDEYYERRAARLRRCVLDLTEVAHLGSGGLDALKRLAVSAAADRVELIVRWSDAEPEIARMAARCRLPRAATAPAPPRSRGSGTSGSFP